MNKTLKRLAAGGGISLLAFTGLIGFAHTEAGRPIMQLLMSLSGCPVSLDGADPVAVEQFRVEQMRERAGSRPAAAHPALSFTLGQTSKAEVQAWADASGARCESKRGGSAIQCRGVILPQQARACAPSIDDLHLQFDAADRLVAVDAFRRGLDGARAVAIFEETGTRLDDSVGPATAEHGDASPDNLEAGHYHHASREYHYSDYVARITLTSFPGRGVRMREQYNFVPPS